MGILREKTGNYMGNKGNLMRKKIGILGKKGGNGKIENLRKKWEFNEKKKEIYWQKNGNLMGKKGGNGNLRKNGNLREKRRLNGEKMGI